jgi:hypothetical protein
MDFRITGPSPELFQPLFVWPRLARKVHAAGAAAAAIHSLYIPAR